METDTHAGDHEKNLASAYARGELPQEVKDSLLTEENIGKLYDALTTLNLEMETQFAERKAAAQEFQNECWQQGREGAQAWFDYKASYDRWRSGAMRFKKGVVGALRDVRRRQSEYKTSAFEARRATERADATARLKQERHMLRTVTAIIFERYGIEAEEVEDRETAGQDSPLITLTRNESDDGYLLKIERRQGDDDGR